MNLRAIWEGKLPLEKIRWGTKELSEYILPSNLDLKRRVNWEQHLKENRNDYDGNLLFLKEFYYEEDTLTLNTELIRFSTVVFMAKNNFSVNIGIGMLGVQCLIFSPANDYILVGERRLSESYYPGITTVPGGMLEIEDLKIEPKLAFMREIKEETPFEFQSNAKLNAVLLGWNNISVTFLTTISIKNNKDFNPLEIIPADKNEWENNLRWLSIEELKNYPPEKLLDGLTYYQLRTSEIVINTDYSE